ncbi:GNAT family N-acetyltransferase [Arthrobacter sp. H14]|uniref:GNAT family N-acetyltransferase n=1 Tax=Arthrobacter sp. H14 TaxID=1312959 RepID=UPI00047DC07A|nr:GNAT family protein [Arthrobacter sp. H14]
MGAGEIPPWPTNAPVYGSVRLRKFEDHDVSMALDLAKDPYVPTIGTLPSHATMDEVLDWVQRQRQRHVDGFGFSSAVADLVTDRALGGIGLWVAELSEGRATAGYSLAPRERGKRIAAAALTALTEFAWTIPQLYRVELYIEPWNTASIRVAERAGYLREGLLRSHQEIGGLRRDMLLYAAIRESWETS